MAHTASRMQSAETLVVMLNVLGMGLMLSTLLRDGVRRGVVVTVVVALALGMKLVAAWALGKPQTAWLGFTPGMLIGLGLGTVLLAGLLKLGRSARLALALACVIFALMAVNFAPDNPYFSPSPQLARGGITHFLSFWSIMRALSELWPLLAIAYLAIAWWRHSTLSRFIMRASSPPAQRGVP